MYGDSSLDSVLAMLGDVQERLTPIEATAQSLAAIRKRAEFELESLQLTKGIEEAKVLLHQLQARQAEPLETEDASDPASDSGRNRPTAVADQRGQRARGTEHRARRPPLLMVTGR